MYKRQLRILRARWPLTEVKLLGVRVQGTEAPPEIAGALRYANRYKVADLIITGRGGGSIEDLWAFNDERVARAIYESEIPVISAVGHEPDVTIADYVADARASTPSNAAEIAVPDRNDVRARLTALERGMTKTEESRLSALRERLTAQDPTFAADPKRGILLSFCVQGCFYAFANNSSQMDEKHLVDLLAEIAKAAQRITV